MNTTAWALRLFTGDTLADKLAAFHEGDRGESPENPSRITVAEEERTAAQAEPSARPAATPLLAQTRASVKVGASAEDLRRSTGSGASRGDPGSAGSFPRPRGEGAAVVPQHLPAIPGRPAELRFSDARAPFPGDHELHLAEARGRALHFFANHEMLALEVMAHALLRFPDAPAALRAGLVGIIGDEQRHLANYLARMAGTGIVFGDLPVNRYFWDALSGADLPGLIAGLSLTFEQANLDFAAHYAEAFRRVDDPDTAGALDIVLADEIRHVRHGRVWFERLRSDAPPWLAPPPPPPGGGTPFPWDAWVHALPAPLTPARAKGTRFFVGPRREAGFDDATITRLSVFSASKGRVPTVWSFHPEVEADVAGEPPTTMGQRVATSFGSLPMFLAHAEDIVLVRRRPRPEFLATLLDAGFALPEFVEGGPEALRGRVVGALRPWGWGPTVAREHVLIGGAPWNPAWRRFYEKSWAVERLAERPDLVDAAVVGVVCRTIAEVRAATVGAVVWKAVLGTAGRGLRRPEEPGAEGWAEAVLASQGAIVVEPWLDRVMDLSMQLDVSADRVTVAPWGRFLADGRGRYQGAVLGDMLQDQPSEIRRLLFEQSGRLAEMARHVGAALAAGGFAGFAGIDALVYRSAEGVHLKPLVEVNPRITMGRVAAAIGRRVRRDRVGLWVQVSRKRVGDLVAYSAALRARAPMVIADNSRLITGGAVVTSDPATAQGMITALVVGGSLAECRAVLDA